MNKKLAICIITAVFLFAGSAVSFAASSILVNVYVSVTAGADITVVAGGPIALGTQAVGGTVVGGSAIEIKNSGTGSNQTYALKITDPAPWTSVTGTPGMDQYRMDAVFDNDGTGITWGANTVLTTTSVPASATQFNGDYTGAGVAYNLNRKIYIRFMAPSLTTSPSAKTIPITITATVV